MTNSSVSTILLVEDNPGDARLLSEMLKDEGPNNNIRLIHADRVSAAEQHLATHVPDVVLLDLGLPDAKGVEAIRRVRVAAPRVPLVVLTGLDDDAMANRSLHEGAQDYLVKGQIEPRGLLRALRYAISRKVIEEALYLERGLAQVTLNCIGDAVVCTDGAGAVSFMNVAAEALTGWDLQDAIGQQAEEVFPVIDATTRAYVPGKNEFMQKANRTQQLPPNCLLIRRDGVEIPVEDSIAAVYGTEGQTAGAVIVFRDVSAARALALKTTHLAEHDFLTGLPNRMLLNDRIGEAIAVARRSGHRVALLFLDLDGFKHVNDSLGHSVGDKLLQSVARRLLTCVDVGDTVSRQGGDEFVVLLSESEHPDEIAKVVRKILNTLAAPHAIEEDELHVTTSVGISIFPDDGHDAETLIKNADTAMFCAKDLGRQNYQFFESFMSVRAIERQSIEEGLRRALQRNEFTLHYQPKVNLETGTLVGAEALIRWTHPLVGDIPPDKFIPIAEECGLILPITRWVLREACTQAQAWVDAGMAPIAMAVNVSALDLQAENFVQGVFATLDETGFDPRHLELELTERILIQRADATNLIFKALKARGVRLSVDDFGTGYSSLSYLRAFPIDSIKIDQSFIRQISLSPDNTSIVTAMIEMGRSLKLIVVAEGVETQEERTFLQAHQCDEAQGYLFGRPMTAEKFGLTFGSAIPGNGRLLPLSD